MVLDQQTQTIFFIADAHLGSQSLEQEVLKERYLCSFLQSLPRENSRLIICGDLFDFWFEYRYVVPRRYFRVLAELQRLAQAGVPIDYLPGNHDFWLGSFLRDEIGITLHRDDMVIEQGAQRVYVRHGDGLMRKDHLYRVLKKVLRFPPNVFFYRWLHPDLGIPLALFFSHLSREAAKNEKDYSDADYRAYAREQLQHGFQGVVLGHSHMAALDFYPGGWYLNPGDWMRTFTYGILCETKPALMQWDGTQARPFHPLQRTEGKPQ